MLSPLEILNKSFNLDDFRAGQLDIINSILTGKDTFAIMPTGGGKSLCYQIPSLIMSGTALIISPLIALMKDQVDTLINKNIPATYLNSSLSNNEYNERLHLLSKGVFKILYLAPERLESKKFLNFLSHLELSFIAIDEAHCISEWGHDFRPAYLNISNVLSNFNELPVHAFTATATKTVQADIQSILKMNNPSIFIKGFDRPNLSYRTEVLENKNNRILEIISNIYKMDNSGSIIIYAGSRKKVESLHNFLKLEGIKNIYYHAGLADNYRKMQQDNFINGKQRIIIATNAFGMGIDKANVRAVIHTDLTQTIESYYQEAGRAGRDNKEAICYFLYSYGDRKLQEFFISMSNPDLNIIENVYNTLYDLDDVPIGANSYQALSYNTVQIANKIGIKTKTCENIIDIFQREGILRRTYASGKGKIIFMSNRERIIEYFNNLEDKEVLESLLRYVSFEALHQNIYIDIDKFLIKYNISKIKFEQEVNRYKFHDILSYTPPRQSDGILLVLERHKFYELPINWDKYKKRKEVIISKLNTVQKYIETTECKRNFILSYFGETEHIDNCGKCTSCLGSHIINKTISKNEFLTQSILSASYQLNANFGRKMLFDFIKGNRINKINQYKLYKYEYFASAKDFNTNQINEFIEKCFYNNLLTVTGGEYPLVKLTTDGVSKIKNTPKVFNFTKSKILENHNPIANDLFNLRKQIADNEMINERSIISDRLIQSIADALPTNKDSLRQLKGITFKFMEQYSGIFLDRLNKVNNQSEIQDPVLPTNLIAFINSTGDIKQASIKFKKTENQIAIDIQELIKNGYKFDNLLFCDTLIFEKIKTFLRSNPKVSLPQIKSSLYLDLNIPTLRVIVAIAKKEMTS